MPGVGPDRVAPGLIPHPGQEPKHDLLHDHHAEHDGERERLGRPVRGGDLLRGLDRDPDAGPEEEHRDERRRDRLGLPMPVRMIGVGGTLRDLEAPPDDDRAEGVAERLDGVGDQRVGRAKDAGRELPGREHQVHAEADEARPHPPRVVVVPRGAVRESVVRDGRHGRGSLGRVARDGNLALPREGLQPAPHRSLVAAVVLAESPLHVRLFLRDHVSMNRERGDWKEEIRPRVSEEERQAEVDQGEAQVHRIPREPIGTARHHAGGRLVRNDRRVREAEGDDPRERAEHAQRDDRGAGRPGRRPRGRRVRVVADPAVEREPGEERNDVEERRREDDARVVVSGVGCLAEGGARRGIGGHRGLSPPGLE